MRDIVKKIDEMDGPVIVHCLKGAIRTGMICAGYQIQIEGKNKLNVLLQSIWHKNCNISGIKEIARYY